MMPARPMTPAARPMTRLLLASIGTAVVLYWRGWHAAAWAALLVLPVLLGLFVIFVCVVADIQRSTGTFWYKRPERRKR